MGSKQLKRTLTSSTKLQAAVLRGDGFVATSVEFGTAVGSGSATAGASQSDGYSEQDTRLCDVRPGFGASATCNMMWSLQNPDWMTEALEYDVRHAHPLGVCGGKAPNLPRESVPEAVCYEQIRQRRVWLHGRPKGKL